MAKKEEKSGWFNEFQRLNEKNKPAPPPAPKDPPPRTAPPVPMPIAPGKGENRRQYARFEVDGAYATLYKEGLLTKVGFGKSNKARSTLDLSEGGTRMLVSERLLPGTRVRVRIEMEKYKDAIETTGVVRWCFQSVHKPTDFFAGVMFLDLDNLSRRKIQLMRDWFTSPQYKAVRETKMRQKRTPSDIIKIGK